MEPHDIWTPMPDHVCWHSPHLPPSMCATHFQGNLCQSAVSFSIRRVAYFACIAMITDLLTRCSDASILRFVAGII